MEVANFRVDPGIQSAFEKASLVRVCAVVLERAGIAGACGCTVHRNPALLIGVQLQELVACGTFPIVKVAKVDKACVLIAFGPLLGTARQVLEHRRHSHQEQCVRERKEDFEMNTKNHASSAASAPSVSM